MPDASGAHESGFDASTPSADPHGLGQQYEPPAIESRVPVRAPLIGQTSFSCCAGG